MPEIAIKVPKAGVEVIPPQRDPKLFNKLNLSTNLPKINPNIKGIKVIKIPYRKYIAFIFGGDFKLQESLDYEQLPYSLEAEKAVLGAILMDPDCLSQIGDIVKEEYFYVSAHQKIFQEIKQISQSDSL